MSYRLTLSEAETYLRKCARATGLTWGIAEEAGKASRWLAAFSLPGPQLVLAHLQSITDKNYSDCIPDCNHTPWVAKSDLLCPVISGAAIGDRSSRMLNGEKILLGGIAYPLLLAATVGMAARCHKTVFTTRWAGVAVSCFENGLTIEGNHDDLLLASVDSVSCEQGNLTTPQQLPSTLGYSVEDEAWRAIDALAFKTYAPATEQSRAGAGAGLTDND